MHFPLYGCFIPSAVTGEQIAKSAEVQALQSKWQVYHQHSVCSVYTLAHAIIDPRYFGYALIASCS
jgi:hypothetical protein